MTLEDFLQDYRDKDSLSDGVEPEQLKKFERIVLDNPKSFLYCETYEEWVKKLFEII